MLFSVIIPTCHRNDLLAKCLDCLASGQQALTDRYEVIVTDDGSDFTAEQMIRERYPWARWVAGPRKGPAANRNNGAKHANGEWIVFTDDDCLPDAGWLEAYQRVTKGGASAMEGAIHPLGDMRGDLIECPVNTTGNCFWSANIALKRDVFFQLGGFDENYPIAAHEDQDMKMRAEKVTAIPFVADSIVRHPIRQLTFFSVFRRLPSRIRNYSLHVFKHRDKPEYAALRSLVWSKVRGTAGLIWRSCRAGKFYSAILALCDLCLLPYLCYRVFWSLPRQQRLHEKLTSSANKT